MIRRLSNSHLLRSSALFAGFSALFIANTADAAPKWSKPQNAITYAIGLNLDNGELDKSRLTITSSNRLKFSRKSIVDLDVRIELAGDNTGLGSSDTFSNFSKPVLDDESLHLEADKLTLTQRIGKSRLILGKQVVAWGVLDGVRITDALNPVRLREGIASENRPDRISLWGVRLKGKTENFTYDTFFAPDPSVNQVALQGDIFSRTATRFRGGFSQQSTGLPVTRTNRDRYIEDAVYGVRLGREIGRNEFHLIAISGPDTSSLFRLKLSPSNGPSIELDHDRRNLFGIDFVRPQGSFVFRAEAAYSPNRRFNTNNGQFLNDFKSGEWTAGIGVDWQAPKDFFVNTQLLGNIVTDPDAFLIRHDKEYLATLTIRRNFQNDTLKLSAETVHSLTDGDNFVRLKAEKELTESFSLGVELDAFSGDPQGIFGQFEDNSRLAISLKKTF